MEITIPVRGKQVKVDTTSNRYDSEVLIFGYAYVVRVGDEVFLAIMLDGGQTETVFNMPKALFDWFKIEEDIQPTMEQVAHEAAASVVAKSDGPPKPSTPEEADGYLKNWRDKGWPKPGGHIYRLAKRANGGAAQRVVADLEKRTTGSRAAKVAKPA